MKIGLRYAGFPNAADYFISIQSGLAKNHKKIERKPEILPEPNLPVGKQLC